MKGKKRKKKQIALHSTITTLCVSLVSRDSEWLNSGNMSNSERYAMPLYGRYDTSG